MLRKEKLKKLKKSLFVLSLLTTGSFALTGCGSIEKEEWENMFVEPENELLNEINGNINPDSEKTFGVGEHYLMVRVPTKYDIDDIGKITNYAINSIPDGYEVYEITPYTEYVSRGSQTGGHDIWFVNNKEVVVKASYNKYYENYGYYSFGEVVQKEETNQLVK